MKRKDYVWAKQTMDAKCAHVDCPPYDAIKDFKRDPSGYYVLIKVEWEISAISVGVCNKDHVIVAVFRGRRSQDIYNAIFAYEKKHGGVFFKEKTHIAYLGKELKKAELALAMGVNGYYQE